MGSYTFEAVRCLLSAANASASARFHTVYCTSIAERQSSISRDPDAT